MDEQYDIYNTCGQLVMPCGVAYDDSFACDCSDLLVIGEVCQSCGVDYESSLAESTVVA